MWKFKQGTQQQAKQFVEGLRSLKGVIPEIKEIQVGINCNNPQENYDAVLVSEFETLEDLKTYTNDPRHLAVSEICKQIRLERVAVDYEI